jgi:hypothetical protein
MPVSMAYKDNECFLLCLCIAEYNTKCTRVGTQIKLNSSNTASPKTITTLFYRLSSYLLSGFHLINYGKKNDT